MIVLCVFFMCTYWSEMLCAHLYRAQIRAGMPYTFMIPDVKFTVIKIVYYDIFTMPGITFITKTNFLQCPDTNLQFKT